MNTEQNILENLKIILSRPFRVYDTKNIDFIFSNKLLRFKYLVFNYKRKYFKNYGRN